MNQFRDSHLQRGATLIVGLIMLAVITLTVTTAFMVSGSNLKAVGNMQFRNEAIAAADKAIEQVVSSPFTASPTAEDINVDINNDGTVDYVVHVVRPACIRAARIVTGPGSGTASSITLGLPTTPPDYNTVWEIEADVTDASSGASVHVHQGVRVRLSQTQYNAVCA
jgi:Tfp pilus assembly protein PilX